MLSFRVSLPDNGPIRPKHVVKTTKQDIINKHVCPLMGLHYNMFLRFNITWCLEAISHFAPQILHVLKILFFPVFK